MKETNLLLEKISYFHSDLYLGKGKPNDLNSRTSALLSGKEEETKMCILGKMFGCHIDNPLDFKGKIEYDTSKFSSENLKALRHLHYGGSTLRNVYSAEILDGNYRIINDSLYLRLEIFVANVKAIDIWAPCVLFSWNCKFIQRYRFPVSGISSYKRDSIQKNINSAICQYIRNHKNDEIISETDLFDGFRNEASDVNNNIMKLIKHLDVGYRVRMKIWWHYFLHYVYCKWRNVDVRSKEH